MKKTGLDICPHSSFLFWVGLNVLSSQIFKCLFKNGRETVFQALDIIERSKVDNIENIYADSLKDDRNFNIVARMLIPLEECKRYCEEAELMLLRRKRMKYVII